MATIKEEKSEDGITVTVTQKIAWCARCGAPLLLEEEDLDLMVSFWCPYCRYPIKPKETT